MISRRSLLIAAPAILSLPRPSLALLQSNQLIGFGISNPIAAALTYATWDVSNKLGATTLGTLSNGNHTSSCNGATNASSLALTGLGKVYVEAQITTLSFVEAGVATTTYAGSAAGGSDTRGFYANGGNGICLGPGGSLGTAGANSPNTANDYVVMAADVPNLKVWLGRIRTGARAWIGGGDPEAGTTPTFSASGGGGALDATLTTLANWYFYHSGPSGADVMVLNAGDSAFNVTVPTGFTGLGV